MNTYRYIATDTHGREVTGQVSAESLEGARDILSERNLQVLKLDAIKNVEGKLSVTEAEVVTSHVAHMSAADLPLAPGLRAAAEESTDRRVQAALMTIADRMERGESLDDVLRGARGMFPAHISGLIYSASRSGKLAEALAELMEHHRAIRELKRSVVAGFAYPVLVVCFASLVLIALMVFVVGTFQQMFEEFCLELPTVVETLFWFRDSGWLIIVAVFVFIACAAAGYRLVAGRVRWSRLVSTMPLFGPVGYWCALSEWTGLLGVLLKHQVPLPEALRLAADGVANASVGSISLSLADGVAQGSTVTQAAARMRRFPRILVPLLAWGENKGSLAEAFGACREAYEQRARTRSWMLQVILPPLLFIGIGCTVLFVVTALFLPLFSLIQGLS